METNNKHINYLKYLFEFTILFALLSVLGILSFFWNAHKSILISWDSYDQQFMGFLQLGRWIRNAIKHRHLSVWLPSIGYGADILLTNSLYIFDPFNWISIITPSKWTESVFTFLLFLRAYCCGITFSVFSFHRNKQAYAVLCGALVYSLNGFVFLCFYQSIFFIPLMLFPLIILGVDELFENQQPRVYVISLSLLSINSLYNTYMAAFLIAGYCWIKWFSLDKIQRMGKPLLKLIPIFLFYSIISIGISAFTFLPISVSLFNMGRLNVDHPVPFLYSLGYYKNLLIGFTQKINVGVDCSIGYPFIGIICVFLLFIIREREYKQLRIEWIVLTICLCVPFIGFLFNGFSYVTNRWVWAYALLISYIVVCMLPSLDGLQLNQRFQLAFIVLIYFWLLFSKTDANKENLLYLFIFVLFFCVISFSFHKLRSAQFKRNVVFFTCLSILLLSSLNYSSCINGNYLDAGTAYYNALSSDGKLLLDSVNTRDGTRYDQHNLPVVRNASWLKEASGINFYMSFYNDYIDQFHKSIALRTSPWSFGYNGLDERSELLSLLGVNHYFLPAGSTVKPIGFDKLEGEGKNTQAWKPEGNNSLFSLFKNSISYEDFNLFLPYERQQVLMQAVVLEKGDTEANELIIDNNPILYSVENKGNGVIIKDKEYDVRAKASSIFLKIPKLRPGELYIFFSGVSYENGTEAKYNISCNVFDGITLLSDMNNSIPGLTPYSHMYGGKHNWLLNLGLLEEKADTIRITFEQPGNYHIDDILVYVRNVDQVRSNIEGLNHSISSLSFSSDQITFNVNAEEKNYLFMAIPYSTGWEAYDNGKTVEILRADVGFMCIELLPGEHKIQMKYHSPFLLEGTAISLASLAVYFIARRVNLKKGKYKE